LAVFAFAMGQERNAQPAARRRLGRWVGTYNDSEMAPEAIEIAQNGLGQIRRLVGCGQGGSITRISYQRFLNQPRAEVIWVA
jgi:hypothetical protein